MSATIGLDIGGTNIIGGVIDSNGAILARGRRDTPALDASAIVEEAADLIRELSVGHKIDGVGVACAAYINRSGSLVFFSPNLAWRDEPLKERLRSAVCLRRVTASCTAWVFLAAQTARARCIASTPPRAST